MPSAPMPLPIFYQKGSSVLSQYACEGFSGFVAIPPPVETTDSKLCSG
jgi:hypothetical protein